MKGVFVTFEGIDGCGKTTQAGLLVDYLRDQGQAVLHTREPGGTDLGLAIRKMVLGGAQDEMSPTTELLLMAADRAHHVQSVIIPALQRGDMVVCERYVDSTEAYQGYGGGLAPEDIRYVNHLATGGLVPDVTFLLDLAPETALQRRTGRTDRFEARELDFHRQVRSGYLAIAERETFRLAKIDASDSCEAIHDHVIYLLENRGYRAQSGG